MNTRTSRLIGLAVGLLMTGGLASMAEAQTTINAGGSSAATPFATDVPLTLCDGPPAALPQEYINGNFGSPTITSGKVFTWICTSGGNPIAIRYSATGSSDGINKLLVPESNSGSYMNYLDLSTLAGCSGPTTQTRPSDGKQWQQWVGCTGGPVLLPMNLGFADVFGASFHQIGPITSSVSPIDQSTLISTQVAVVPFTFALGSQVGIVDPGSGNLVPVASLSNDMIRALFSRQVTDWAQLGMARGTMGSPPGPGPYPVTLCGRVAGSGTKATLDVVLLGGIVKETPFGSTDLTNAADGVYFGASTQDVRDCIGGNTGASRPAHPGAIGYMEVDQAVALANQPGPVGRLVRWNGFSPYDTTLTDPKNDLHCGKWEYWTGERANTRNPSSADPATATLISNFIATAMTPTTISHLPAGLYWEAFVNMNVSKNSDQGPLNWKAAPEPNTCVNH